MELRHLRYFLAVAEEEHFGRAAERLHIVQPALSMQIKALETELGGPLFIRTSRRVELTEAGSLLLSEARLMLEQMEHTRLAVQRAIRGETGRVRVGFAGNAIFSGKMITDVRRFRKTHPDAEVTIQEIAPQKQVTAILAGHIDVGYTPDNSTTADPQIRVQKTGNWEMIIAMCDDHPLAIHPHLSVEMLAGHPLVLYDAHDANENLTVLLAQQLGDGFCVAHRSNSTLSVLAFAAAGLGLALVPAPLQQVQIPGLIYRNLNAQVLTANLVMISRMQEPGNAVTAFLAMANLPC
ncbi:LysR family transcriptional regulator [Enterobacter hormaechei]|nr:LysR family transcriptional regulator [Enterobacter hormaechei]